MSLFNEAQTKAYKDGLRSERTSPHVCNNQCIQSRDFENRDSEYLIPDIAMNTTLCTKALRSNFDLQLEKDHRPHDDSAPLFIHRDEIQLSLWRYHLYCLSFESNNGNLREAFKALLGVLRYSCEAFSTINPNGKLSPSKTVYIIQQIFINKTKFSSLQCLILLKAALQAFARFTLYLIQIYI